MIRIVLAEDAAVFRMGLRQMLEADGRFDVVGEAGDGMEAVAQAMQLCPDVVVMDLRMPRMDGIAAARIIHDGLPAIRVVILTEADSVAVRARAMAAGCAGYCLKSDDLATLPDALAGWACNVN
jgi:two-component system, NarL family, response regulator LiaR